MPTPSANLAARELVLNALRRWSGSTPAKQKKHFEKFVEGALPRIRGPFLARHTPTQVLALLEKAFLFAQTRQAGVVSTQVESAPGRGAFLMSCMDDQSFIVDTIQLFLRRSGAEYEGGFNLVYPVERTDDGAFVGIGGERKESLVLLEASGAEALGADCAGAAAKLREHLELARAMVSDFKPMVRALERLVVRLENQADHEPLKRPALAETAAFVKWLLNENFVFMAIECGEPLGFARVDGPFRGSTGGAWPTPHPPGTVRVRKSHQESPIHRAGRIDEILITAPDDPNEVLAFVRGMFTYRAVTQASRHVPILRQVLASILEKQEIPSGSFRYKGIANAFDSLATELLFTTGGANISDLVDLVFEAEQQHEVEARFIETGDDTAICLIAMPKAHYSEQIRGEIEARVVGALGATYSDHGVFIGRFDTVLLHYYLTGFQRPPEGTYSALAAEIKSLATPWGSRLWAALAQVHGDEVADRLADTYGTAFPEQWRRTSTPEQAVDDIGCLEALAGSRNLVARVYVNNGRVVLRLYQSKDIDLTALLPVIDNFGLVVRDSWPAEIKSRGGTLWVDTFHIKTADPDTFMARATLLVDALSAVFAGDVSDDPLNRLVVTAGLDWREVDVLRGYLRYCRQLKVPVAYPRAIDLVLAHPGAARALVRLFSARLDPAIGDDREARVEHASLELLDAVRRLRNHDEHTLVAAVQSLILGTVRTNAWRPGKSHHYLSFKFECARVPLYGKRRPKFEIFVHHREVEGVHLRFAKVARGGLRWSDRDDYRTEVLGLVTTQQVKNVVIVPDGAKGGFFLKNAPHEPALARSEADRLYKTFIRGLLDVTDNNVGGAQVRPPGVFCYDDFDPYLVVAADKGTAHLSDTANRLSLEYGHWLGDAFASGGSNGYDHKGVGITARGGWVVARRSFAELGRNPYTEAFTCVGVGDMGGDVFGNGLIESDKTKLLAAFNHRHIFLDPNPDPAASYVERRRLFDAGPSGGGWQNYDRSLISEGGGVFERQERMVPLSPQARAMLGIVEEEVEPETVIRHILKMDVDLLWNGGIGTYVKASFETHADVDDRSNDALRVDATDLRCRAVGEGGNLGFTQAARIEAALRGVAINTDFIDNSGGVDLSDHEVNLKILLTAPLARGELDEASRNALLASMTDEVAGLVLRNNDRNGRQISRDVARSRQDVFPFARAISFLEERMDITRDTLRLPSEAVLADRVARGEGLTRPEVATLTAWVKMYVRRELVKGRIADIPGAHAKLVDYFPSVVKQRFPADIERHLLAAEVAMTEVANCVVADAGAAFFPMMIEATGRTAPEIAAAYLTAQGVARVEDVREELEDLRTDGTLAARYRAWIRLDAATQKVCQYWLSAEGSVPAADTVADLLPAIDRVYELQGSEATARDRVAARELTSNGMTEAVAQRVLKSQYLDAAIMVWSEARRSGRPLSEMATTTLAVGQASRLAHVLDLLERFRGVGRWEPLGVRILERKFKRLLRELVVACNLDVGGRTVDQLVPVLQTGQLADVRRQVEAVLDADTPSLASLMVLEARVAAAVSRVGE
jgi:glutamate dehydrogenase